MIWMWPACYRVKSIRWSSIHTITGYFGPQPSIHLKHCKAFQMGIASISVQHLVHLGLDFNEALQAL